MERTEQRRVIEALILAAPEPISATRLAQIVPDCTASVVQECVAELNEAYGEADRAFEIWEVAGGYQMRTRAEFSGYLQQLQKQRPLRLSRAALETLAIVAYKQPVTRAEVEQVRGVDVGAVLKSLLERQLVRIAGHREVPGRPILYGTSRRFLEVFGLESLKGLPALRELDELARDQGLAGAQDAPGDEGLDPETGAGERTGSELDVPAAGEAVDETEAAEAAGPLGGAEPPAASDTARRRGSAEAAAGGEAPKASEPARSPAPPPPGPGPGA